MKTRILLNGLLVLATMFPAFAMASEKIVKVKGMVCAFCAQGIEKKFKAQAGVEKVEVNLGKKIVKLQFTDGKELSNEKISAILKDSGYDADFGG